jgi:hypothetical protein
LPNVKTEFFALAGGLDLVSPALTIPPGMAIDAMNFEPSIYGGYSRMRGIERYDGRTAPSDATYYVMATAITVAGSVVVGDTVTGTTSGATAVVLSVTSQAELIVTRVTGTFVAETLNVNGAGNGAAFLAPATMGGLAYLAPPTATITVSTVTQSAASTPLLHATYNGLAADSYRALIGKVPGSGAVRGVKYYDGVLYAFRDNVGATACVMHRATTAGWVAITFGREVQFSTAVGQIFEGDTVVGAASGASAVATRALLRTGTWTVAGVGTLVFDTVTGAFTNGEALKVAGVTKATASTASTAIALLPGGKYQFDNNNFGGSSATYRMYGCDGMNLAFDFDGTRLVPIRTGFSPDAPKYVAVWQSMLVIAIGASVGLSSIGDPYGWNAVTGAAELALGDTCTGLLPQIGNATTGALAAFTASKTFMVYGTSSADINRAIQSPDAGAQPYTAQNIGMAYYMDTRGVVQINATQAFGNFESATITRAVQPLIDAKRGMAVASCIVRNSNQYRLFFSDGTGITLYITQQPNQAGVSVSGAAIMPFDYGSTRAMSGVDSVVDASGIERLFGAGADGYVYELNRGTSMDGGNIAAFLLLAFNNSKSPRVRKHYKRAILQAACAGIAQVNVGYDLTYAGSEAAAGYRAVQTLFGAGGYWDAMTWDSFNWDSPVVQEYRIDTPGNGRNIGVMVYGDSAIDSTYTISSAIINYSANRLER